MAKQDTHVKAETVVNELRPPPASPVIDNSVPQTTEDQSNALPGGLKVPLHPRLPVQTTEDQSNALPGIKMPFILQPYFSTERNRQILLRHLEDLSPSEKQEYVDNLSEIVQAAQSEHLDVPESINSYIRLKEQQISRAAAKNSGLVQTRLYIAGGAVSILGLIGLFSLILVLLAIERNTRLEQGQGKVGDTQHEVAK
jgi:hypothetical protein